MFPQGDIGIYRKSFHTNVKKPPGDFQFSPGSFQVNIKTTGGYWLLPWEFSYQCKKKPPGDFQFSPGSLKSNIPGEIKVYPGEKLPGDF